MTAYENTVLSTQFFENYKQNFFWYVLLKHITSYNILLKPKKYTEATIITLQ